MNGQKANFWYVYMLRCEDFSIYTGITTDIERRYRQHYSGKGAKYTRIRKVKEISAVFQVENRSFASKLEYYIKKLSKKNKEFLLFNSKNREEFIKEIEKKLNLKIFLKK